MRLPLAILLLGFATATASGQNPWRELVFGQSRDGVRSQLENANLAVESTPDGNLQSNADSPLPLPGLANPIPVMATFLFDTSAHLTEVTLSVDLPALRRDYPSLGSDEALYNFAADKLGLALAGQYGNPVFSSIACSAAPQTAPCTLQWRSQVLVVQLESTSAGHHVRVHYLPVPTTL